LQSKLSSPNKAGPAQRGKGRAGRTRCL